MIRSEPAGSTFFVGDIQGCLEPLTRLLKKARFNADHHHLLPVGDTINRGPHNVATLELLRHLGAEPILGNHEYAILEALRAPRPPPWLSKQSVSQDLLRHPLGSSLLEWVESWPVWVWGDGWLAVHAGVHPQLALHETSPEFLLTVRLCDRRGKRPKGWDTSSAKYPKGYRPWHAYYKGDDLVVYGHWARQGLRVKKRSVGLDSGCVYGGGLSGMWYPSRQIVQVES